MEFLNKKTKQYPRKVNLSAQNIATATIITCNEYGIKINKLKLQGILYYLQLCSYQKIKKPLFREEFTATAEGVIIKDIDNRFKKHGNNPILAIKSPSEELLDEEEEIIQECMLNKSIIFMKDQTGEKLQNQIMNEYPYKDTEIGKTIDTWKIRNYANFVEKSNPIKIKKL